MREHEGPITCGLNFTVYLDIDGVVWACGKNGNGALGVGDKDYRKNIERVHNLPMISKISSGQSHTLFLDTNGSVWSCGWNNFGQLGLGNESSITTPERIDSLPEICSITASYNHSLFTTPEGVVWACGWNYFGQIGAGEVYNLSTPTVIKGLPDNISVATGGFYHSIFIESNGSVWVCGNNTHSQLGLVLPENADRNIKRVLKLNNIPPIIFACGGQYHTLLLDEEGKVWACGSNISNRLGVPDLSGKELECVSEILSLPSMQTVAAGLAFSVALDCNGGVWCAGQVGEDPGFAKQKFELLDRLPPCQYIAAGHRHIIALGIEQNVYEVDNFYDSAHDKNSDPQIVQQVPTLRITTKTNTKSARKIFA